MNNKSISDWCPIHSCKRSQCLKISDDCSGSGKSYLADQLDEEGRPKISLYHQIALQHLQDPKWFSPSNIYSPRRQLKNYLVNKQFMDDMMFKWYEPPKQVRMAQSRQRYHHKRLIQYLHYTIGDIFTNTNSDLEDIVRKNRNIQNPVAYLNARNAYELLKRRNLERCDRVKLSPMEKYRKAVSFVRSEYPNSKIYTAHDIEELAKELDKMKRGDVLIYTEHSTDANGMGKQMRSDLSPVHPKAPSTGLSSTSNQMPAKSEDDIVRFETDWGYVSFKKSEGIKNRKIDCENPECPCSVCSRMRDR